VRPVLLQIEGFASFREPTTVDFADVDLFAFTGPTGAGKSSLIDSMAFSLYGSVHRYDDERLVGAVVTTGMSRAKVSFTFSIDGALYRAVRLVKITSAGRGTTPEARLERVDADGETLETVAGDAGEVTQAVTRLLGLNFAEFCRVVVLPQGDFQRFMHAKSKERRDLLFRLLDLEIIDDLAGIARQREAAASAGVDALQTQADALAHATPDAIAAADERVADLASLLTDVGKAQDELAGLQQAGKEARAREQEASARADAVAKLTDPPERIVSLSRRVVEADKSVADAAEKVEVAKGAARDADGVLTGLPAEADLREAQSSAGRLDRAVASLEQARKAEQEAAGKVETATSKVETAKSERDDAAAKVARIRNDNLAHTLADSIEDGDDCPVCLRAVEQVPFHVPPEDLEAAEAELAEAEQALESANDELSSATGARSTAQGQITTCQQAVTDEQDAVAQAAARLPETLRDGDQPDLDAVQVALDERADAASKAQKAHQGVTDAEEDAKAARARRSRLDDESAAAWNELSSARDTVAVLSPPALDRDLPLADAWERLAGWAREQHGKVTADKAEADQEIAEALRVYQERYEQLRETVTAAGVPLPEGTAPRDAVVSAHATAQGDASRLRADAERAEQVAGDLADAQHKHEVAKTVAKLLDSRNFAAWVGNRVLLSLTEAASGILNDLSGGVYSLTVNDKGAFEVIDHINADEVRSAKTLSGGETFLASLALALALAEHVTSQSAGSTSRLESLMLDEGFGTLDSSTLDLVATAIEELGDRGRMVGLITHIPDLAERVPVRFEVAKGPHGSKVSKLTA
jgi:DNA repair protein SbcC/Rad50